MSEEQWGNNRLDILNSEEREEFLRFRERVGCLTLLNMAIASGLFLSRIALFLPESSNHLETAVLSALTFWLASGVASWTVMALGALADITTTIIGVSLGASELNLNVGEHPGIGELVGHGVRLVVTNTLYPLVYPPIGTTLGMKSMFSASRNAKMICQGILN